MKLVAIDGKTLNRSFDHFRDRKAAHMLSAFASDTHLILGHLAIDDRLKWEDALNLNKRLSSTGLL